LSAPGENEIHLWFALQNEVSDEMLLRRYRELLTDEELQKAARFYFERHRRQYLITRALVRTVLSSYSGFDPRLWRFSPNAYGRPEIAAPVSVGTLSFNVAHTEGLIVCACAGAGLLGVDAEYVRGETALLEIAAHFFSASETAELRATCSAEQTDRFFHFWTLKESYVKAVGAGLSIPLDLFSFSLACTGHIALRFDRRLADDPERWACWLMKPAPGYVAALCAERLTASASRLIARKVVPLVSSEPLDCVVIAQVG
jgi:4'-phosphopantetheinyl transferase